MDWIHFAEDRDKWQSHVITVLRFGFHKILGIS